MHYTGPPGMMLDLVGPSPDGVDLEWSHPYSNVQPYWNPSRYEASNHYNYANNSPLLYVDPSGLWGVATGHHYFPVGEQGHFASKMTDAARRLAEGYYTGPTIPPHGYGTYGGVTHYKYNAAVRREFEKYLRSIGKESTGRVNAQEMRVFIEKRLKSGAGEIGSFNKAVEITRAATRQIDPTKLTNEQLKILGKQFRNNRRAFASARLLGVLAIAEGIALNQAQGFLEVSATSPYVRRAYQAAEEGDVYGTNVALLGSRSKNDAYGLYDELVARGYHLAALDFEKEMTAVFKNIRAEQNAPIGDSDK